MHFHPRLTAVWPQTPPTPSMWRNFHHHLWSVSPHLLMQEESLFVCLFFTLLSPCSHHNEGTSSNETKRKYSNILYTHTHTHIHAQSLQSCLTVWDPIVYSLPGSSVHGVLQTRILEWVVTPSSRGSSRPRDSTHVSCLLYWQGSFLPLEPPGRSI